MVAMERKISRRILLAGGGVMLSRALPLHADDDKPVHKLKVAIFSKHLQFLAGEELASSCLYGCFSRPQYVVFAAKLADESLDSGRDRRPITGLVRPLQPRTLLQTGTPPPSRGAAGPQRLGTSRPACRCTTTSGGLLKQPDKQKLASYFPAQKSFFGCEPSTGGRWQK